MWAWITRTAGAVAGWFAATDGAVATATAGIAIGWVALIIIIVVGLVVVAYVATH
jgi:hypothetical protein